MSRVVRNRVVEPDSIGWGNHRTPGYLREVNFDGEFYPHIDDKSIHFSQEEISLFENQIVDFGNYANEVHNHSVSDIVDFPTNLSQFNNDVGYITDYTVTEDDVHSHLQSYSIPEQQIIGARFDDWNTAYGWGDHSQEGYLKSVGWNDVHSKPITFTPKPHSHTFTDLPISQENVTEWNNAYTWGDHSNAGYLKSDDIQPILDRLDIIEQELNIST